VAESPHLLQFRVSHYSEKVRWALDFKRWSHTRETLVPCFHIPRVRRLSGQNKVPVLVLEGEPIAGSDRILVEMERLRPEPALFPRAASERERALAIQKYFDEEVGPDTRRLFWASYLSRPADCARMAADGFAGATYRIWRAGVPILRPLLRGNMGIDRASIERARGRLVGYFERLESEIGPRGHLVGDRFTVADLAAAAVMTPIVRPPEFPYPLPEPWPPELVELRRSVADRRGFRWVLETYARHRGASSETPSAC
jgi:glutathione S-transferase